MNRKTRSWAIILTLAALVVVTLIAIWGVLVSLLITPSSFVLPSDDKIESLSAILHQVQGADPEHPICFNKSFIIPNDFHPFLLKLFRSRKRINFYHKESLSVIAELTIVDTDKRNWRLRLVDGGVTPITYLEGDHVYVRTGAYINTKPTDKAGRWHDESVLLYIFLQSICEDNSSDAKFYRQLLAESSGLQ
jgi:hypothetical protein